MTQVSTTRTIEAPARNVWELIEGFDLKYFGKYTPPTRLEGSGVGCTRTVTLPDGVLVEQIEVFDPDQLILGYTMLSGPYPVKDYHARIEVIPKSDSECEVHWSAEFEPKDVTEEAAQEAMAGVFKMNLGAIAKAFKAV